LLASLRVCLAGCTFFFFFQAEDGIRDRNVTGVQTCALPIWIAKRTAGQRRRALTTTSRSAADSRPQISPTVRGRKGSGCLREEANSPSADSTRLSCSSRASSSPRPTGRMSSASSWRLPRLVQNVGFAWTTTRAPGTGSTGRARSTCSRTGTEKDMSTSTSRRVMKLSPAPGRRLSWTISPSTHSGDIRATYSPTFTDSCRRGQGFSAVVCAAVAARAGRGVAAAPASGPGGVCVMGPLWHELPTARRRRTAVWMREPCGGMVSLAPPLSHQGASAPTMGGVSTGTVLLAEPRGYCAGVDRAVVAVERALEHYDETIYVRH